MALLWQQQNSGKNYQVRSAGASIRLYTNGVFHSQFNPNHPLGGGIWDLLAIPPLFKPETTKRVLILGLGGGAVVRCLQFLLPHTHITAIELDPTHIKIATEYFGVRSNKSTRIINADAIQWLKEHRGEKFDFILDDLFVEKDGYPDKAINNQSWTQLLLRNLSINGVLAINFDSNKELRKSVLSSGKTYSAFASRFCLSVPKYDNRILALFKTPTLKKSWQKTLQNIEAKTGKSLAQRLCLKIRKV